MILHLCSLGPQISIEYVKTVYLFSMVTRVKIQIVRE